MVADMDIASLRALANCDAIVDAVDVGTQTNGICEVRTLAKPGAPDLADAANVGAVLVSINFNAPPAFGAAADQNPGARATVNGSPSGTAGATGTAAHFRVSDRAAARDVVWQNSAGGAASGEGMELSNTSIASTQVVTVTAWTVDVPET